MRNNESRGARRRIVNRLTDAAARAVLRAAAPQSFPGVLVLSCEACPLGESTVIDRQLTGADLVDVTSWLNRHSGHGARELALSIPAGVDTSVDPSLSG